MMSESPPNLDMAAHEREAQRYAVVVGHSPQAGTLEVGYKFLTLFDGGRWDPKTAGEGNNVGNMEYEAFGNWQYGYLGRMSGFSENFLLTQAGNNQHNPRKDWGDKDPTGTGLFGTGNKGDDPADTPYIKIGFAGYNAWENNNPETADAALPQTPPFSIIY